MQKKVNFGGDIGNSDYNDHRIKLAVKNFLLKRPQFQIKKS